MRDITLLVDSEKKAVLHKIWQEFEKMHVYRGLDFYIIEIEGVLYLVQENGVKH